MYIEMEINLLNVLNLHQRKEWSNSLCCGGNKTAKASVVIGFSNVSQIYPFSSYRLFVFVYVCVLLIQILSLLAVTFPNLTVVYPPNATAFHLLTEKLCHCILFVLIFSSFSVFFFEFSFYFIIFLIVYLFSLVFRILII